MQGGVGCQREGRGSATCAGNGLCEVAEEEEEEYDLRTTVRISVWILLLLAPSRRKQGGGGGEEVDEEEFSGGDGNP